MDYLTTSQIADFNNPMAFAKTRTTRVGQTELGSLYRQTVRTKDIEESYRLVLGATEKTRNTQWKSQYNAGVDQLGYAQLVKLSKTRGNLRKTSQLVSWI